MEYTHAIRDLLGESFYTSLKINIDGLPDDNKSQIFPNISWSLSSSHIETYAEVLGQIVSEFPFSDSFYHGLMPCWRGNETQDECIREGMIEFAKRAHRTKETEAYVRQQLTEVLSLGSKTATSKAKESIALVLSMPEFLYKDFNRDMRSDPFAIAGRLSLAILQSIPDNNLIIQARSGILATDRNAYEFEVDRLFRSNRSADVFIQFMRIWLGFDQRPSLSLDDRFAAGIDTKKIVEQADEEFDAFVRYIWENDSNIEDLFDSPWLAPLPPNLEKAYAGSIESRSDGFKQLDLKIRGGILGRVRFLLALSQETNPIHRGSYIRQRILCDTLSRPNIANLPPGSLDIPPVNPQVSTIERWTKKTSPAPCVGCHLLINPLGFSLENLDSLGRYRLVETTYDETGTKYEFPIATNISLQIEPQKTDVMTTPGDLFRLLSKNDKVKNCFAKQWFRFAFNRLEVGTDVNFINDLSTNLISGLSIRNAIKTSVKSKYFLPLKDP